MVSGGDRNGNRNDNRNDGARHRGAISSAVALIVLVGATFVPAPVRAASLVEVTGFGTNPGNLRMFKYVPDTLPAGAPLVVLLHGCTQTAASYDAEPGWTKFADQWRFALVLPQQQSSNNSSGCFNWFESGDYARGVGEALSIKQMVDKMKTDHSSDAARVHVSGLSSGGAMTAVMLATYPEVFAGGAIMAGVPYKCATGVSAGFSCMNPGVDKTPQQWGDLVRGASSHTGPWPKVSIWHGSSDTTVQPVNATESMQQWTNVHGVDQTADVEETIKGYPHKVYNNAAGAPVVETYTITGMGHGTAVDPGAGADQCGTAGAYILDVNVCSTYFVARFLGLDNTDAVAPTISITAPANGAGVSGVVTITASASDNIGVSRVEFFVDGVLLETDTTSPYSALWDTAGEANGSHSLTAKAYDAAGNTATSPAIGVTVSGGVEDVTPPSVNLTFPTNGSTVSGTVTMSASASDDLGVTKVEFFVDAVSIGTGTPAGPAGPWTLAWNTTGVAAGSHTLMVKAFDAKGNTGTDNDTTVTVSQTSLALEETFSDRDSTADLYDTTGWTAGGYETSADNHTVAPAGSSSALGYASSGISCATGVRTETLSRSVTLGSNPKLTYWRKLDLMALVNISTTASFKAKVNTTVVDQQVVTYANYAETAWTQRASLDLAAFANQTVTLAFEVSANSNVCIEVWAKAWLDDITISNPAAAADTTAPTVNVTTPLNGATVSGAVDVTATASDGVGVAKVELYVDGTLLATDTSSPYSITWDTTSVPNGSHRIMAKANDAAGNVGTDDDTTVTVSNGGGSPVTLTINNDDTQDGYVKANSDGTASEVGTLEATYGLAIGRGTDAKYNRSVLSFNTSSIPDTATITRAYITVTRNSSSGDPWANPAGNTLVIDVKTGCFGACTIETGDWASAATASAVAGIVKWTSGSTSSGDFSSAGIGAVSKTGTTQVKLRFSLNQTATNYIFIGHGTTATLRVEYV